MSSYKTIKQQENSLKTLIDCLKMGMLTISQLTINC